MSLCSVVWAFGTVTAAVPRNAGAVERRSIADYGAALKTATRAARMCPMVHGVVTTTTVTTVVVGDLLDSIQHSDNFYFSFLPSHPAHVGQ